MTGFVLKKATPFHPLVDDHFPYENCHFWGSIPHFHKHPNSYGWFKCWLFPLKNPMKFENLVFNGHKNIRIPKKKGAPRGCHQCARQQAARCQACTRMYVYIYIHTKIYMIMYM